jgi:hypothetical protein
MLQLRSRSTKGSRSPPNRLDRPVAVSSDERVVLVLASRQRAVPLSSRCPGSSCWRPELTPTSLPCVAPASTVVTGWDCIDLREAGQRPWASSHTFYWPPAWTGTQLRRSNKSRCPAIAVVVQRLFKPEPFKRVQRYVSIDQSNGDCRPRRPGEQRSGSRPTPPIRSAACDRATAPTTCTPNVSVCRGTPVRQRIDRNGLELRAGIESLRRRRTSHGRHCLGKAGCSTLGRSLMQTVLVRVSRKAASIQADFDRVSSLESRAVPSLRTPRANIALARAIRPPESLEGADRVCRHTPSR